MGRVPTIIIVSATAKMKMNAFCLRPVLAAKYMMMDASITMEVIDWEEESPNILNSIYIISNLFTYSMIIIES